ncbi:hypothetical protein [Clostridium sp. DJ247]|uniref:hypothetical protein n=1 Tax=Clostridium sp. DJ247 TaxID=2726188 RepID=UPI0016261366|nr:hypothetical protein [Clostridium sp. DJ247]MBC2579858.1 hypothetical protein [Clostridium sp. DJ247]
MNLQQILSTPATIAALITGIVAFIGVIIQFSIFFIKYDFDKKSNFEQMLKDKLEKIYSPLTLYLNKSYNQNRFITDESIELISKYGHLLSKELINNILEILKNEQISNQTVINQDFKEECKNLKKNVLMQLNREFIELQEKYNKNFFQYKIRYLMPWYIKVGSVTKKVCISITITFYIIFIIIFLLLTIVPKHQTFKNPYLNSLLLISLIIVIITTLFSLGYAFDSIISKLNKNKKCYMTFERVPDTGIYKCLICKRTKVKFIKGSNFQPCTQHTLIEKIKSIFRLYNWSIDLNHNNIIASPDQDVLPNAESSQSNA